MNKPAPDSAPTIQAADPGARKRAIWLITAIIAAGLIAFLAHSMFEQPFNDWARNVVLDLIRKPGLLYLALFLTMLPLLAVCVYLFFQGSRIVKAQRMPYPGQKVIKDTPVITGQQAKQRGRAVQMIAVFMGLLSVALPFIPVLFMLYLSKGT
jgi:hypothetical protein